MKWQRADTNQAVELGHKLGFTGPEIRIIRRTTQQKRQQDAMAAEKQRMVEEARARIAAGLRTQATPMTSMALPSSSSGGAPSGAAGKSGRRHRDALDVEADNVRWMPRPEEATKLKIQALGEQRQRLLRLVQPVEPLIVGDPPATGLGARDFLGSVGPVEFQKELLARVSANHTVV